MARRGRAERYSHRYSLVTSRRLSVVVPMPVSLSTRIVTYRLPDPRQRSRRVIRVPLTLPRRGFVMRKITVRVPRTTPVVRGSYVSIDRYGRLNIHSKRQYAHLMVKEQNKERRNERKSKGRKARNGQLESVRADRFGIIGAAHAMGLGAARIADAAMVSRSLGGS